MAVLGSSASRSASMGLTPSYINDLIRQTMSAQRQPITRLTAQKDELNVKKAVYADLKNGLMTFNNIVRDLDSDNGDTVFESQKLTSSDTDVLTATVDSDSSTAINGTYTFAVSNLAEAQMIRSDKQTSSSDALNLSGIFTINGEGITVENDDSLQDIANAINNADYEDGEEARATIVDDYLVIEAESTGISNQLSLSDTTGTVLETLGVLETGSVKTTLRNAEDAAFTVNDISITRASNTGLDDVIEGATLSLISETEGTDTVTLTVENDNTAVRSKISAFVSNLNATLNYLKSKTQTVVNQEEETYTRGVLAGDTIFSMLRSNLLSAVRLPTSLEPEMGDPVYLADIGISVESGLTLSLDTSELNDALETNFDGVMRLFDGVMDRFANILDPFTTEIVESNTLDLYSNSVDTKIENIDGRIDRIEKLLVIREEQLIGQYSALYVKNVQFTEQQYNMLGIYSNFSTMA